MNRDGVMGIEERREPGIHEIDFKDFVTWQ